MGLILQGAFGYIGGAPLPFAESGPGSSFTLATCMTGAVVGMFWTD